MPFEFTLPDNCPSSIMYENFADHDKPVCKIKYSVETTLLMQEKQQLKYKQLLIVHEKPVEFQ